MKTLLAFGERLSADKIVKTADSVIGYTGSTEAFTFRGVRDFTRFALEGSAEWDLAEATVGQLDVRQTETEGAVLTLMELQMTGGL